VCVPLVARTVAGLLAEAQAVVAMAPDLIEWRVDFFEGIADTAGVVALSRRLKAAAGAVPLLFTRRSAREGGEPVAIGDESVLATQRASERLAIPVVSMAMGPLGAVTRVAGSAFGSAMTFARGEAASAPGQMPVADVRACLDALARATHPLSCRT